MKSLVTDNRRNARELRLEKIKNRRVFSHEEIGLRCCDDCHDKRITCRANCGDDLTCQRLCEESLVGCIMWCPCQEHCPNGCALECKDYGYCEGLTCEGDEPRTEVSLF